MAQKPPSSRGIFEFIDSDELRAMALERWNNLRNALGRARSARIVNPDYPSLSIGRFEGIQYRSRGGFGVVFEARDPILDRRVAVKFCIMPGDETREQLLREAKLMAKFSHPNIVRVYETGRYGDDVFFVMEYVEGETGHEFIKRDPRPSWAEIVDLYRGAGAGLAAAHEQGIVHSDVKPGNILLGADDWPLVTDFGLAHRDVSDEGEGSTRGGTPSFMAPEVLLDWPPSALSDQWSFCVSLWVTFDRALPFTGRDDDELLEAIEAGPVAHDPSVPEPLRAVARRGLSLDPRARFPDMQALLAELDQALQIEEMPLAEMPAFSSDQLRPASPSASVVRPLPLRVPASAASKQRQYVALAAASAFAASLAVALVMPARDVERTSSTQTSLPEVPTQKRSTPTPQAATSYTTQCNTRDTSIVSISKELEAVCVDIRKGNLKQAFEQWDAVRDRRYPEVGADNYDPTVMRIAAETKVVADTFDDQASTFSDTRKTKVAREAALAMVARYLRDYQNLEPSRP